MLKFISALIFFYTANSISFDFNIYNSDKNKVNIFLAEKKIIKYH